MRILSCYIEGFGVLREKTIVFDRGLNQFLAENGSGKSTLLAFIRAMLYGLPASTKQNPQENDRRHYTPWQGGRFGGSITFEARNKRYTATRLFGSKESADSFMLYDAVTGAECSDFSESLGEELFSVGSDAFMRSAAIPSFEKDRFAAYGSGVSEKLSSMIEVTEGTVPFEEAFKALEKQRKLYIKTGNKGLVPETEERLDRLHMAILEAEKSAEAAKGLEEQLVRLRENRARMAQDEERVSAAMIERGRAESALSLTRYGETLRCEAEALWREEEEARRCFGGTLPDDGELLAAEREALRLSEREEPPSLSESEQNELLDYRERFGAMPPNEDIIGEMARENACAGTDGQAFGKRKPLFLVLAIIALLCTATGFLHLLCIIPAVLLSVLFFILYIKSGKSGSAAYDAAYSVAHGLLSADCERYRRLLRLKEERQAESDRRRREDDEKRALLLRYFAAYGENTEHLLLAASALRARYTAYVALLGRARAAEERVRQFVSEHGETVKAGSVPDGMTVAALTEQRDGLRRSMAACDRELSAGERMLLPLRETAARLCAYRDERALLHDKCENYRRQLRAIEGAEKYLSAAKEALSLRYLSDMQASLNRYMEHFMPKGGSTPILSSDLSVKMKSGSVRLSPLYYSDGTQDILSFCMHMALSDALFTEELPPLFFDDSFLSWDDEKMEKGLDFLRETAKTRQIIYFTCQEGRTVKGILPLRPDA